MPTFITTNSLLVFFSIILLGTYIGKISVKNISLGSSAIFLVALIFGHFGFSIPHEIRDVGLILFVYAISIQVGPYFFKIFRKDGWKFVCVALFSIFIGMAATVALAYYMHIPDNLAVGMYSGAVTSTPSLAVAVDMMEKNHTGDGTRVTAGYGIAYPFSVVVTVIFVQLLPWILRRKVRDEEDEWEEKEKSALHHLSVKQFKLTNAALFGKTVEDLHTHSLLSVNLSRVRRGMKELVAVPSLMLKRNDIITAVGEKLDLERLLTIIGPETTATLLHNQVVSEDVEIISPEFVGKKLGELSMFYEHNIVAVRVIRQDTEVVPTSTTILQAGDILRMVGEHNEVNKMIKRIGVKNEKLNETNMLPFILGLVFGVLIGSIPIPVFGGTTITLGASGGALIAGLFISHRKRIGKMEMHVPVAALNLIREIGITFFLAGAGLTAGTKFVEVFREYGSSVLFAGAFITLSSLAAATFILVIFKEDILSIMGGVSGAMTQTAALVAAKKQARTELPTLVYASIYPFATIGKVIFIQFLVYALWKF